MHDTEDRPIDPHSPEVPPAVRARVLAETAECVEAARRIVQFIQSRTA